MMRNHCLTVAGQRGQELVSELSGNTAVGKMKHDSIKKSWRNFYLPYMHLIHSIIVCILETIISRLGKVDYSFIFLIYFCIFEFLLDQLLLLKENNNIQAIVHSTNRHLWLSVRDTFVKILKVRKLCYLL